MRPEHITIDGGVVTNSTTTGADGTAIHHDEIGKYRFFVSITDENGHEHPLWDGSSYDAAIRKAEHARNVLRVDAPIRDIVAGAAQ